MQRRKFITATGTLAIGSGTALGTGAFDATSSSSESAMSIVTQGEDAEISIDPGAGVDSDGTPSIESGDFYTSDEVDELNLDEFPKAVVKKSNGGSGGPGMVHLQIIVPVGSTLTFDEIVKVTNNSSSQSYNLGFIYEGGINSAAAIEDLTESKIANIFQFQPSGETTVISGQTSPQNTVTLQSGDVAGASRQLDLKFNGDMSELTGAYSSVAGDFVGGNANAAETQNFIDKVTAVANEV